MIQKGEENNGGQNDAPEWGKGICGTLHFFLETRTVYPNSWKNESNCIQMQKNRYMC